MMLAQQYQELLAVGNYGQLLALLSEQTNDTLNEESYVWLGKSLQSQGLLADAVSVLQTAVNQHPESSALRDLQAECAYQAEKFTLALQEVADGKHQSDQILFVKNFIHTNIHQQIYESALHQLRLLAAARKAKTTNILWIGQLLVELYFKEGSDRIRPHFDKLSLDEMQYYYLKTCKFADPGYAVVKAALKQIKD